MPFFRITSNNKDTGRTIKSKNYGLVEVKQTIIFRSAITRNDAQLKARIAGLYGNLSLEEIATPKVKKRRR